MSWRRAATCWTPSSPWASPARARRARRMPDFVQALHGWTAGVAAGLSPTANLLFAFLCRLEPEDRRQDIVAGQLAGLPEPAGLGRRHAAGRQRRWPSRSRGCRRRWPACRLPACWPWRGPSSTRRRWRRCRSCWQAGRRGRAGAGLDPAALPGLLAGLEARATTYTIHPGVAETARAAAEPAVLRRGRHRVGQLPHRRVPAGPEDRDGGRRRHGGRERPPRRALPAAPGALGGGVAPCWKGCSSATAARPRWPSPCRCCAASPTPPPGRSEGLRDAGVLAKTLCEGRPHGRGGADHARRHRAGPRPAATTASPPPPPATCSTCSGAAAAWRRRCRWPRRRPATRGRPGWGRGRNWPTRAWRLQVLAAMGRYDEVLAAVEARRPQMDALPEESEAEEAVDPWNVRETLLDTGRYGRPGPRALGDGAGAQRRDRAGHAGARGQRAGAGPHPLQRLRPPAAPGPHRRRPRPAPGVPRRLRGRATTSRMLGKRLQRPGRPGGRDRRPGRRPCAGRRSPWATRTRPATPKTAPSATTTWPATWSARAPTRRPSWPTAWRLPPSAYQMPVGRLRHHAAQPGQLRPAARAAGLRNGGCAGGGRRGRALRRPSSTRLPRTAPDGDAAIAAVWQLVGGEIAASRAQRGQSRSSSSRCCKPSPRRHERHDLRAEIEPVLADLQEKGWHAHRRRPPHLGRRAGRRCPHRRPRRTGRGAGAPRPGDDRNGGCGFGCCLNPLIALASHCQQEESMGSETYIVLRVLGRHAPADRSVPGTGHARRADRQRARICRGRHRPGEARKPSAARLSAICAAILR